MKEITYRKLTKYEELEQVSMLEKEIWHSPTIPIHQTLTAIKHGGLMLGAFDSDKLVGFSYGFAGFEQGEAHLVSHMLGISLDYREHRIGEKLKRLQRDEAFSLGYTYMNWTYDPLQTRNGYLNLSKLSAVCDTYIENCYGEMKDGLNEGLSSDRFQMTWHTNKSLTYSPSLKADAFHLADAEKLDNGLYKYKSTGFNKEEVFTQRSYLIPIPANIQELKDLDMSLAIEWRQQSRDMFQTLFAQGYIAVELVKGPMNIHYYLLIQKIHLTEGAIEK